MTNKATSISLYLVLPVIFMLGCSSTKYVNIEDPSERIVSGCISMLPPSGGEWYVDKHWTEKLYGSDPCEDRLRLASGDVENLYFIYITSGLQKWNDKINDENLRLWFRNIHDRKLLKNRTIEAENMEYETETCNGIEGKCAEASYSFISSKRLQFYAGGPTTTFRDIELRTSDKYFYEAVEFYVLKGPYDSLEKDRNAFYFEIMFLHVSIHETKDPDLRKIAYKVVKNIDFNEDWYKKAGY